MNPRPQNYCSFYVKEPFVEYGVDATSMPDYCFYNTLKIWRRTDRSFNYYDAHCLTYNLRDGRSFDEAKQIIHERIDRSKNLILILTSHTQETAIMNEEIAYGLVEKCKPIVVLYPELTNADIFLEDGSINERARTLWNSVPVFRQNRHNIFVQHVPFVKSSIHEALNNVDDWLYGKEKADNQIG